MNKIAFIVGMFLVVGCSGGIDDPTFGSEESTGSSQFVCIPGETQQCFCSNDTGAQKCNDDGSKYLECVCDGSNGSGGNDSSTSSGNGGNYNTSSSNSSEQTCTPRTCQDITDEYMSNKTQV